MCHFAKELRTHSSSSGRPRGSEGLSDAMTWSLFDLENLTVYFCLTCGVLAKLSEMKMKDG